MELTEKRKNKFTNWLLAIVLGAICGLMSIGASMINNAKKVSAYEHLDNGELIFGEIPTDFNNTNYDANFLHSFFYSLVSNEENFDFTDFDYDFDLKVKIDNGLVDSEDYAFVVTNGYLNINGDTGHLGANFVIDGEGHRLNFNFDYVDGSFNSGQWELDYSIYLEGEIRLIFLPSYEGYYSLLQYTYDYHENINQEGMQNILTYIVGLLTGGIVGLSGGIGQGVSTLTSDIFISNGLLSAFGGMIILFASISLAIGLCRWIMQFLTSLGAKK